jgi:hypothetical protein
MWPVAPFPWTKPHPTKEPGQAGTLLVPHGPGPLQRRERTNLLCNAEKMTVLIGIASTPGRNVGKCDRAGVAAWLGLPDRSMRVSGPRAYGHPLPRQQVGSGDEEGCTQWVYYDFRAFLLHSNRGNVHCLNPVVTAGTVALTSRIPGGIKEKPVRPTASSETSGNHGSRILRDGGLGEARRIVDAFPTFRGSELRVVMAWPRHDGRRPRHLPSIWSPTHHLPHRVHGFSTVQRHGCARSHGATRVA